jgi:Bacterial membrane protein YfhO
VPSFRGVSLRRAAPGFLALPVVALFFDALFRDRILYERDILGVYYGQAEAFVRCVAAGSWPLWDPWLGFGQPMLANPGVQVFYPWTWLNLVLTPATWYNVFAVAHVWLAGVGTVLFARRLGLSEAASLLAGALWMTSGPLLSLVSLWHHLAGAALLPWVLLAADRALDESSPARILQWGGAVALQVFAGSADVLSMTVALQALLLVRRLARADAPPRSGSPIRTAALAALVAAGLGAPQWVPSVQALRASSRADLPDSHRTYWSLHPASLVETVLPVPRDLPLRKELRERLLEGRERFLPSLYLGLSTLPLAAGAFARRRRLAMALSLVGLVALGFALGTHGPLHAAAVSVLPPLGIFRYPVKAMVLVSFVWSLLGALGLDGWRGSPKTRAALAVVALLCGLGGLVAGRAFQGSGRTLLAAGSSGVTVDEALSSAEIAFSTAGALTLAMAPLLLLGKARGWSIAVAAISALDLTLAHRALNPTAAREAVLRPPAVLGLLERDSLSRIYSFDYWHPIPGKAPRRKDPSLPFFPSQLSLPPPLRETLAVNGLLPSGTHGRFGLFGSYDWDLFGLAPAASRDLVVFFLMHEDTPGFRRLLEAGGVSRVIAAHREGLEDLGPEVTLTSPVAEAVIRVFRVPDPLARAYAVGGTRIARGNAARALLVDPSYDPRREVLLPDGEPRSAPPDFKGDVRVVSYRPDRVQLTAELGARGFVVLADAFDFGWKATVDGRPATIRRANEVFRAVEAPAGRHEVELVYRPRSVAVGLLVGALTLFGSAAWGVVSSRRKRARSR